MATARLRIVHAYTDRHVVPTEYQPNTEEATYIGFCVNNFRHMINTPAARRRFYRFAAEIDNKLESPWYRGRYTIQAVVDELLDKVTSDFPTIYILMIKKRTHECMDTLVLSNGLSNVMSQL